MKTSVTNLLLILIGALISGIGVFRSAPFKIDSRFWLNTFPLSLMLIAIVVVSVKTGGVKYLLAGLDGTIQIFAAFLLTLMILFPLIGFSGTLTHHFEQQIGNALAGSNGYLWSLFSAFITPGSNALNGVVSRLWVTHKELQPMLIYFMTIMPLLSFNIFQFRRVGLAAGIDWRMLVASWLSALWLWPFFFLYGKIFYKS